MGHYNYCVHNPYWTQSLLVHNPYWTQLVFLFVGKSIRQGLSPVGVVSSRCYVHSSCSVPQWLSPSSGYLQRVQSMYFVQQDLTQQGLSLGFSYVSWGYGEQDKCLAGVNGRMPYVSRSNVEQGLCPARVKSSRGKVQQVLCPVGVKSNRGCVQQG